MMPQPLKMWSLDIAREQTFTLDMMREICQLTLDAGYTALGLYLEHRFDYSIPGRMRPAGCLRPEDIRTLESEFPDLLLIPMINLLGHMEGFLRTAGGEELSEEPFKGLQACPSNPKVRELASAILRSTLDAFSSPIIHIGGDETSALGKCPRCEARVKEFEEQGQPDGKAALYADWFLPFIEEVRQAGRTPALWADMLIQHPAALEQIPRDCLLFDWQYFTGPAETSAPLKEAGFSVIACPALHTYNAPWLHLPESAANIREHIRAKSELGLAGVCVTTWECGLYGSFETLLPAITAAGKMLNGSSEGLLDGYGPDSEDSREWAHLMGVSLPRCGEAFAFSRIRSGLKCRFMLYRNPFLLWLRQRDMLTGPEGDEALAILEKAEARAPSAAMRGVSEFVRLAIQFCRDADAAAQAYEAGNVGACTARLAGTRSIFTHLERLAEASRIRFGGSEADSWRARGALEQVEAVIRKVKNYGDGSLGYIPSFACLCHPMFTPGDEGAWWLVNSFARE